jgi:ferredoxin
MPHVITQKCLDEQYGTCVSVCPSNSIHPGVYQGKKFMAIDPETCIDCGMCLPECPIGAIVGSVDEDPAYAKINAECSKTFKNNPPVDPRPANDPPKRPDNKLVNG